MEGREQLIYKYFSNGHTYKEIKTLLSRLNGITISLRQLKRIISSLGLYRRRSNCSFQTLCDIVETEINTSGSLLGYRGLHHKIRVIHDIQVSRSTVRQLQQILDPVGVAERRAKRLRRRQYITPGPNFLWHLDGYDKLKRYGICIHGCIDGFSRKLLWLKAASTNNNPAVIAHYFVEYVESIAGTAYCIRGDNGTENLNVAAIQRHFRADAIDPHAGEKSFSFGRSTSNQRIEAFWSQLRRSFTHWWMNYFKDMIDEGVFDETDEIHRECLKFCFLPLIQKELDKFKRTHNTHRIRPIRNQETVGGKPDMLYHIPESYGAADFKYNVGATERNIAREYCSPPTVFGCDEDFETLALQLVIQNNLRFPKTCHEAKHLYDRLLLFINDLETRFPQ